MKEKTFTRKELYDLVWEQPMSKLAEKFNTEPQRLKKICIDSEIPLPHSGYWSKVRFNKKVVKPPLSFLKDNDTKISLNPGQKIKKFRAEYQRRAYELEQQKELSFKVPSTIKTYHPLVRDTKNLLEEKKNTKGNQSKIGNRELTQKYDLLPIRTDSRLRSRALRFMDTFIRVVEAMGHKITFEYNRCHVEMFGQMTEINLRQKYHRIRKKDEFDWSTESWEKTDKLEFQAGPSFNQKSWIDKKTIRLEEYLPQIIAWIEKDCQYWHDLRAEQAVEKNKKVLLAQKLQDFKEARESEITKFKTLLFNAERFEKAKTLRVYINALEEKYRREQCADDESMGYLNWARRKADWLDPLKNAEDSILGSYDSFSS